MVNSPTASENPHVVPFIRRYPTVFRPVGCQQITFPEIPDVIMRQDLLNIALCCFSSDSQVGSPYTRERVGSHFYRHIVVVPGIKR